MVRALLDADCVLVIWVTDAASLTLLLGLADRVAMRKRMLREPLDLTLPDRLRIAARGSESSRGRERTPFTHEGRRNCHE